jgi:hypothetical protein
MFNRKSLQEFTALLTARFPHEFTATHVRTPAVMEHLFAMCGGLPHAVTESDIETANIACYVILYPEAATPFIYEPETALLTLN